MSEANRTDCKKNKAIWKKVKSVRMERQSIGVTDVCWNVDATNDVIRSVLSLGGTDGLLTTL